MTDTRDMKLGGRTFDVPALPLGTNRKVYPLCRDLVLAGILERALVPSGMNNVSDDEWDKIIEIAWLCARMADPELTREAFDGLPITPVELFDAFFFMRYQTGVWIAPEDQGDPAPGEAQGAASPPTSTSTESSPG